MQHTYGLFGFEFSLELSTRPDNFLGDIETWNKAEEVRSLSPFCVGSSFIPDLFVRPSARSRARTHAQQLRNALDKKYPGKWELNPGDGAFYGPKIDITIRDALKRSFQCATIQLDFQLPDRFNLKYRAPDEPAAAGAGTGAGGAEKPPSRPVIIHRAILGSLERFIAIITEHFAGKWCVSFLPPCPWGYLGFWVRAVG